MLTAAHWWAVGVYWIVLLAIGLRFFGQQRDTSEFFLAGRRLMWPAVAMSMYASVTSAVTLMGVPAQGLAGRLALVLVGPISLALAPWLAKRVYPAYRRTGVTTTYEFLEIRLGRFARQAAAILFLATRLSWLGLVVYAPALAVSAVTGLPLPAAVIGMGTIATAYTAMGGLAAVVWTDVVQFVVMVGGLIWVAVALVGQLPGGVVELGAEMVRRLPLRSEDWWPQPGRLNAFAVLVAYPWLLMHEYGIDQVTAQRLLAVSDLNGVRRAIVWNAVTDAVMVTLLLAVGVGLACLPASVDRATPPDARLIEFAVDTLPPVVGGLLLAAVFAAAMSSLDSGLNSAMAVIVGDILRPIEQRDDSRWLTFARRGTILLGAVATLAGLATARIGDIVRAFFTFTGLFSAPVLALFLFAMGSRRIDVRWWVAAAIASVVLCAVLWWRGACHEIYLFPLGLGVSWGIPWIAGRGRSDTHGESTCR